MDTQVSSVQNAETGNRTGACRRVVLSRSQQLVWEDKRYTGRTDGQKQKTVAFQLTCSGSCSSLVSCASLHSASPLPVTCNATIFQSTGTQSAFTSLASRPPACKLSATWLQETSSVRTSSLQTAAWSQPQDDGLILYTREVHSRAYLRAGAWLRAHCSGTLSFLESTFAELSSSGCHPRIKTVLTSRRCVRNHSVIMPWM